VKDAEPDGYKILCLHNAIITAELSGSVDFGPKDFESIALTGELALVIMVREDAPYQDLPALLQAAKERPKEVRFGANQGAPAYYATLQLESTLPGADFSIVSADGGADRYAKIIGGHLDAGIFSLSEYLDFRSPEGTPPDRNIRAIAIMSPKRSVSVPEIPTAIEQGVPVFLSNAHYWWAPKGTPKPIVRHLATALEKAMQNKTVKQELGRLRVDQAFESGERMDASIAEMTERFKSVVVDKQSNVPNFITYVAAIVAALLLWVIVESLTRKPDDVPKPKSEFVIESEPFERRPGIATACFVGLAVYVLMLGKGWLPFAIASAAMVLVVGGFMTQGERSRWPILLQLALLTGFGTEYLFTQVFETALP
jgi:tripartite-type tricarboxylate transporter receptor subunit TctC